MLSTYHEFVTGVASFALSIVKGKNTAKMQPLKLNENKMSFCENFPFDIPSKWNFKLATVWNQPKFDFRNSPYKNGRRQLREDCQNGAKPKKIWPMGFDVCKSFVKLPAHVAPFILKRVQTIQQTQMNIAYDAKVIER